MARVKFGDKVTMNGKYFIEDANKGKTFTVASDPRNVCGVKCVFLVGCYGCYPVDGLKRVTRMFNLLRRILRSKKEVTFREVVEAREDFDPSWGDCPADYDYLNSDCSELSESCKKYCTCTACWNQTMKIEVREVQGGRR